MEHDKAMDTALRWHPEWRDGYRNDDLHDEAGRHLLIHAAVEGMLSATPRFASIAGEAERRGIDEHEVRHALGRALCFGLWYDAQEGTGYDQEALAQRFLVELRAVGSTGDGQQD